MGVMHQPLKDCVLHCFASYSSGSISTSCLRKDSAVKTQRTAMTRTSFSQDKVAMDEVLSNMWADGVQMGVDGWRLWNLCYQSCTNADLMPKVQVKIV